MGDELRDDIGATLVRFIASVVLHNHVVAQRVGLGPSDSQFMTLLNTHGPLTPGQLAEHTSLSTGTVTGVLDRLERGGFVRRERDPADRRKVLVVADEQTLRERLAPHYAEYAAHLDELLRRRSPGELRVIADFLAELTGSAPPQPTTPDAVEP
ncbi:MarR family winged helix-turn-helix transcriptional regulator [Pseudonocardia hispaniensis]|uniref:MarR family winged helix-turn-helix transcriptional regulator n=1 Tax=Pseudonocardia hispaniensis TaxID=904933 RepID=A0ABW1J2W2_9PSEU